MKHGIMSKIKYTDHINTVSQMRPSLTDPKSVLVAKNHGRNFMLENLTALLLWISIKIILLQKKKKTQNTPSKPQKHTSGENEMM